MPTSIERPMLLAVSLLMLIGCGEAEPCSLSGTVLVDDVPAEGVYLVFDAVANSDPRPDSETTRSGEGGRFTLKVDKPGEWTLTAFWPKVTQKDGDTIEGADQFGGSYRDKSRPVSTLTIHRGENEIQPISLKPPTSANGRNRGRH
ncbi:hypothetical protein P12x_000343 [Tundrisphaera lichenicola]|uniref:hypothetical protein n=1 Tax=Tundrisphaera lichenicola TaxID=2029860 RepID=UPI003EBF24DC